MDKDNIKINLYFSENSEDLENIIYEYKENCIKEEIEFVTK